MRKHSLLPLIAPALLLMAGCATFERDSQPPQEPESLPGTELAAEPDPFEAIDQAIRRLGERQPVSIEIEPVEQEPVDLWQRLVGRFAFAECAEDSRAERWANWFSAQDDYMERVFARARPWLHHIANEIEARDLPGELALVPIVESAYDPFAYSHGRAAGTWQFIASTARDHGLSINDWYDGRRDVYASTSAALDYLGFLGQRFDNEWPLALAAYNAGQGRVGRALQRAGASPARYQLHRLPLPRETLAYVPKITGLGCLFAEPERFGFELPVWEDQPGFAKVELTGPIDIVQAAFETGLDLAELVALNPGLNRHLTPPEGPHHLIVPKEHADNGLELKLRELEPAATLSWREVEVRRGDTLSHLAVRHNTSIDSLRSANGINGDRIAAGQRLRIPDAATAPTRPELDAGYRELARLHERLLPSKRFIHQVRPGESLWVIARRYNVTVADLQRWNGLGNRALIRPGQRLMVNMERQGTAAAQPAARRPDHHTVRQGESLWLIARRHRVRLADLMEWNNLDENSILRPGQRLVLRAGGDA